MSTHDIKDSEIKAVKEGLDTLGQAWVKWVECVKWGKWGQTASGRVVQVSLLFK